MFNSVNAMDWEKIYSQLHDKRKTASEPIDVGVLLRENDYPPILDRIHFKTTRDLGNLHFRDLVFINCNFHENTFSKTYFSRVIFKNCVFEKVSLDEAIIGGCIFERCEFTGLRISQSGIHETLFTDTKIVQSHFQSSVLSDIGFIRIDFRESDCIRCAFQNAIFSFPNLSHSSWHQCELKEVSVNHGNFDGACFWKSINQNVIWTDSHLTECLMLENSAEPLTISCTARNVTRPVVGMSWNFNARTDYAPIIARALRNSGAILLKIEAEPEEISNILLQKEVEAFIPVLTEKFPAEILSISSEILRNASSDSQVGKIRSGTFSILQYCSGLALPGGSDLEPEFYGAERDPHTDRVRDVRRSIVEFALLFWTDQTQLPTMGTCRGAQLINVYFGGTLKQHVDSQCIFDRLQFIHLSDSSRKEEFFSFFGSDLFPSISMHHQAIDKVGKNLEVICEFDTIPKLLLSSDDQYIVSQIHPEVFASIDALSEDLKPAQCGQLLYQLFLKKVLEFQAKKKIKIFHPIVSLSTLETSQ